MVAAPDMCRHRVAQLQLLRRTQRTGDLLLLHVLCTPSQQALSSQGRAQGRVRFQGSRMVVGMCTVTSI
jgi:hypothetical protein